MFDVIAFDADDTLWHNETLFNLTQEKFAELLLPYHETDWIASKLYETETRNLDLFGYGVKGFVLSMIETAIELTEGHIKGEEIQVLIEAGKGMLQAPVTPLAHVKPTLESLSRAHELMVVTKGDLFDQESKLARSGLGDFFRHMEVVSEKGVENYRQVLVKYGIDPRRFLMIGNSLKSDIFPVIEIGGHAIHIPYHTTWQHERVDAPGAFRDKYFELEHIGLVPKWIRSRQSPAE